MRNYRHPSECVNLLYRLIPGKSTRNGAPQSESDYVAVKARNLHSSNSYQTGWKTFAQPIVIGYGNAVKPLELTQSG